MKVIFESKEQMTNLSSGLNAKKEYELISDKNQVLHNVHFNKGVPIKMTGILAKLCLESGEGTIRILIPEEENAKKEFEESVDKMIEQKVQMRLKQIQDKESVEPEVEHQPLKKKGK